MLNAGGADFFPDGFDGLHDFSGGLFAGEGEPALVCAHAALVDAGILGKFTYVEVIKVVEERGDIIFEGDIYFRGNLRPI